MSRTDESDAARRVRSPLRDDQLERLLEDFFRQEMPAELRASSLRSRTIAPVSARESAVVVTIGPSSPPRPAASGRVGVGAAALALVLAVWLVRTTPDRSPAGNTSPDSIAAARDAETVRVRKARSAAEAAGDVASDAAPGYRISENVEPLEPRRIETGDGPVEQRSERRITKVSVFDPETGERLEVELPELTIEIIPIKD